MYFSANLNQEIMKINNQVNQEVIGYGLERQKVYILDNLIVIIAKNKRVPALANLDNQGVSTLEINYILLTAFKERLKELLEKQFGFKIVTILKDYDIATECAGTIIVLEKSLKTI
ncbi:MAG: Na-translocating system protein MpsC family protein [Peptococcaceae bacterium]